MRINFSMTKTKVQIQKMKWKWRKQQPNIFNSSVPRSRSILIGYKESLLIIIVHSGVSLARCFCLQSRVSRAYSLQVLSMIYVHVTEKWCKKKKAIVSCTHETKEKIPTKQIFSARRFQFRLVSKSCWKSTRKTFSLIQCPTIVNKRKAKRMKKR